MMKLGQMLMSNDEIGANDDAKCWNWGKCWCQMMKLGQMRMPNHEIGVNDESNDEIGTNENC